MVSEKLSKPKDPIVFSQEELTYISNHRSKIFLLGRYPYSGMDYFKNYGVEYGYLPDIIRLIKKETGLQIDIVTKDSWQSVLSDLKANKIDLLFGAKATPERLEYMTFSDPIFRHPYAVLSRKQSVIKSIADLDGKHVGFLDQDTAIMSFQEKFNKIQMIVDTYPNPTELLSALNQKKVDGVIIASGSVLNQFLAKFPNIDLITEVNTITSDMTLAVKKENVVLTNIINKVLAHYAEDEVKNAVRKAEIAFNRKSLALTKDEIDWLDAHPVVVAGVSDSYLPINHYANGEYKGIAGAILTKACDLVGLRLEVVPGKFTEIYGKAIQGEIDVISMAKSEERLNYFIFTDPLLPEPNIIYGRRELPYVYDIYGLEGKRIAVIPGYWYHTSLKKNLSRSTFIEASTPAECLKLLKKGKADYFIENPIVTEYHISGLGYSGITEKGVATSDSLQYFAINKNKPVLASVLNKSLQLVSHEEEKYNGMIDIPSLVPSRYKNMSIVIIFLSSLILLIIIYVLSTLKRLTEEKSYNKFLEERTKILFVDSLTGVKNRASFYESSARFDTMPFPQTFVTIDINNLKTVNDNYGHHMGDRLIRKCSDILQMVFPKDLVFRMGGDEFLVIYFPKNQQQLLDDIHQIETIASNSGIEDGTSNIKGISMAIGFYTRQSKEEHFEEAIKKSDHDMYTNKKKMKGEEI